MDRRWTRTKPLHCRRSEESCWSGFVCSSTPVSCRLFASTAVNVERPASSGRRAVRRRCSRAAGRAGKWLAPASVVAMVTAVGESTVVKCGGCRETAYRLRRAATFVPGTSMPIRRPNREQLTCDQHRTAGRRSSRPAAPVVAAGIMPCPRSVCPTRERQACAENRLAALPTRTRFRRPPGGSDDGRCSAA